MTCGPGATPYPEGRPVEFVKEHLPFTGEDSPMANLMLSFMGAFAEFERSLIRERRPEGIALAKQRRAYPHFRRPFFFLASLVSGFSMRGWDQSPGPAGWPCGSCRGTRWAEITVAQSRSSMFPAATPRTRSNASLVPKSWR